MRETTMLLFNKILLVTLLAALTTEVYSFLPCFTTRTSSSSRMTTTKTSLFASFDMNDNDNNSNVEAMERIKSEYKKLQKKVIRDFLNDGSDAVDDNNIENALQKATLYKFEELTELDQADCEIEHAHGDIEKAQVARDIAHEDAISAHNQASMLVKSMDGTRKQRLQHDLSDAEYKARMAELEAKKEECVGQIHEINAQIQQLEALELLRQLEEKEKDLKVALQEATSTGGGNDKQLHEEIMKEHESFLNTIRSSSKKLLLVEHDNTKGYEL